MMETITHQTETIDRNEFKEFRALIDEGLQRIRQESKQDGNAGVYYKLAGEFMCWAADYVAGKNELVVALLLFKAETSCDCSKLINEVEQMIAYCERCLSGQQDSPLQLSLNKAEAAEEEPVAQ